MRLRVLVLDDYEDSAAMMALLLRQLGHEVRKATTAAGVGKLLECGQWRPDLCVLDLAMPGGPAGARGLGGLTAAQLVRGVCGRGPLLVAHTGLHTEECRELARRAGFDRYLVKPAGLGEFMAALEAAEAGALEGAAT